MQHAVYGLWLAAGDDQNADEGLKSELNICYF